MRRAATFAAAAVVATATACTGGSANAPASTGTTTTRTVVSTRTVPAPKPTFTPAAATSVAALAPGVTPHAGEVAKACPYIASTPQDDPSVNVADIDGSHVYRTTVLTRLTPVGCRFYFYAPPYEAITDIVPRRFRTALAAHNAMVLTAQAGTEAEGKPDFVPGVDAVLYRTRFFGADGDRDWACVFAAGRTMVIVHTQRFDTSLNALLVARAIARKF